MDFRDTINYIKFTEKCTQKDIAELLGVKNTYLSDVLNGRHPVSKSIIDKLVYHYPYISEKSTNIFNNKKIDKDSNNIGGGVGDNNTQVAGNRNNVNIFYLGMATIYIGGGVGDNNTQVAGNRNNVNTMNYNTLDKALEEIAEQRKLVAKAQEQIDKLLELLSRK